MTIFDKPISEIVAQMNRDAKNGADTDLGWVTELTTNLLADSDNLLDLADAEYVDRKDLKKILDAQRVLADKSGRASKLRANGKLPPFTGDEWLSSAPEFSVRLGETDINVKPKKFKTGSYGSFGRGTTTIVVDGKQVPCSVTMTVVVNNSKLVGA